MSMPRRYRVMFAALLFLAAVSTLVRFVKPGREMLVGPDVDPFRGTILGPVWVPSGLGFDVARVEEPSYVDAAPDGAERVELQWTDPDGSADFGPARVDVLWTVTPKADWLTQGTICDLVQSRYSHDDGLDDDPIALSSNQTTTCLFSAAGGEDEWLYTVKVHEPRCDRHALTIARVRYLPPGEDRGTPPEDRSADDRFRRSAKRGGNRSLYTALAEQSHLLASPRCAKSTRDLATYFSLAAAAALAVTATALRRWRKNLLRASAPPASFAADLTIAGKSEQTERSFATRPPVLVLDSREHVRRYLLHQLAAAGFEPRMYGRLVDLTDDLLDASTPLVVISAPAGDMMDTLSAVRRASAGATIVCGLPSLTTAARGRCLAAGADVALDETRCTPEDIGRALGRSP